jgi:hypothetical protein
LPIETRLALAYKFKGFEEEKAKIRELAGVKRDNTENNPYPLVGKGEQQTSNVQSRGTLGEIAKMAGVGHTTAEEHNSIQLK